MAALLLRRLLATLPVFIGVTVLSFLLLNHAPGSYVDRLRLDPRLSPAMADVLERRLGLDLPWPQRYMMWLAGTVRGDLGFSLVFQRPVQELLREGGGRTLALLASGALLGWLSGLGLGLVAAARRGGALDRTIGAIALMVLSFPPLVLAIGGLALAATTGALPLGSAHLLLPAVVLAMSVAPLITLQVRGALVEVLPSAFVRAARSRGLHDGGILVRHALRACLASIVSVFGQSFPRLLNGALIVEVVTGWPGIGRLALEALFARDSFLLLGVLVASSVLVLLANLISDVLAARFQPRLRLEQAAP